MGHQSIYKTNGTGRDLYIACNNGGFSVMNGPRVQPKPGAFLPKLAHRRGRTTTIDSKSVNYRTDGTGRDSYINLGNGGFFNSGKKMEYREKFKSSLR